MENIPTAQETYELQQRTEALIAKAKTDHDADAENAAEETLLRTQQQIGGQVYRVPVERVPELREKIAKISRKASKLGTEPVSMNVTEERESETRTNSLGWEVATEYAYVIVRGETPVIKGWEFIGTLKHNRMGNEVVRMPRWAQAKRHEIDLTPFERTGRDCQHCNKIRVRNNTYLILNQETGIVKQVGSTCLGDFTGYNNPQAAAAAAEGIYSFSSFINECQREVPRTARFLFLRDWLAYVAREVRLNGWVSGKQAYENGGQSSAKIAKAHLLELMQTPKLAVKDSDKPLDEDYELADSVIKWVREDVPTEMKSGEFKDNLQVAFGGEMIGEQDFGLTAAAISSYRWAQEKKFKAQAQSTQEYYGKEKERFNLKLQIEKTGEFHGDYGLTTVYTMKDDKGRIFKWFSTSEHGLQVGERYWVRGTIRKHEVDRYTQDKTTVLTRCKVGDQIA